MSTTLSPALIDWEPELYEGQIIYRAMKHNGGYLYSDGVALFLTSNLDGGMTWASMEIVSELLKNGQWEFPRTKPANPGDPTLADMLADAENGCEPIAITPWLRNHDDIREEGDGPGCMMRLFLRDGGRLLGVQQVLIDMFDTVDTPIERLTFHQRDKHSAVVVRMDGITIGAMMPMSFTHEELTAKVELLTGGAA